MYTLTQIHTQLGTQYLVFRFDLGNKNEQDTDTTYIEWNMPFKSKMLMVRS